MTDGESTLPASTTLGSQRPGPPPDSAAPIASPAPAPEQAAAKPAPPVPLTAEEQMALFEEDLKDADWGHQPC